MSTKLENAEKNVVKLTITVSAEKFDEAMKKSYKKNVGKISLPGFRKGHAPKAMIERYYGESVFYEDAIDFCVPEAYENAIEETKIEPVGRPELDVIEIGQGKDFVFTITVTVKPEVTVKDYKGVTIDKIENKVLVKDVNAELKRMQEANSRLITVENRATKKGDTIVFDFEGSVDGVVFEGGTAKDYTLELGSNQFIPGFEDQLIGKKAEKEVLVNVTFPEDYHAEELKGKDAVFKCVIHTIKEKEVPALDDDFAKDVSEFDTIDELTADVKARLTKEADEKTKAEKEEAVLDKIIENMEADIPACMYDNRIDELMRDYAMRLAQQGMDINTFMQYTGMSEDMLKSQFRPQAEKQVKIRLALEKIAELEKIVATEEDVENELKRIAELYNIELEKLKETTFKNEMSVITEDVKIQKTLDFVVSKAKMAAKKKAADEAEAEEKPAKTTKAKTTKKADKEENADK